MPLLGTQPDAIDLAEDRGRFGALLGELGLKAPPVRHAHSVDEALGRAAGSASRCSCGRATCSAGGRWRSSTRPTACRLPAPDRGNGGLGRDLPRPLPGERDRGRRRRDLRRRGRLDRRDHAARRGGRHPPGDCACVLPPHTRSAREMLEEIREATRGLALALGVVGLINVQYAVDGDDLYVIEANPRASRTVPFVSKAIGVPLAKMACRVMLGESLRSTCRRADGGEHVSVKEAVLPFDRFAGADALLGPEMRSTGEVMGVARDFPAAFAKAQAAAGSRLPTEGTVFITVTDSDKPAPAGSPPSFTTSASGSSPRGHGGRHPRMGIPVERIPQDRRRLPRTWSTDRARRGRSRYQHPDRIGRPDRRLGDPPRRVVARDPCITTLAGGMAAARDRRRAGRATPGVLSLQEIHREADWRPPTSKRDASVESLRKIPAIYAHLSRLPRFPSSSGRGRAIFGPEGLVRPSRVCRLAARCRQPRTPPPSPPRRPERSLAQRMDALQRANEIRSKRAQLKRDLKGSRASIHQLLLDPPGVGGDRQGLRHAPRGPEVRAREGEQDPGPVPDLPEQDDRRALPAPGAELVHAPIAGAIVITGPRGSGRARSSAACWTASPTWSSRCRRRRAARGREERTACDYWFLYEEEFAARARAGEFVEHAEYSGRRYGRCAPSSETRGIGGPARPAGDRGPGRAPVAQRCPTRSDLHRSASTETLRARLIGRGTDDPEQIERRLETAERELAAQDEFPTWWSTIASTTRSTSLSGSSAGCSRCRWRRGRLGR